MQVDIVPFNLIVGIVLIVLLPSTALAIEAQSDKGDDIRLGLVIFAVGIVLATLNLTAGLGALG